MTVETPACQQSTRRPGGDQNPSRLPSPRSAALWRALGAVSILFVVSLTLIDRFPNALFEDDAYFYFVIAEHLALTGRSTFDSIALTNGYHPTWLLTLALPATLLGALGVDGPLVLATVFAALSCLVLLPFFVLLRPIFLASATALALYCGLGMETPAAAVALVFALRAWRGRRSPLGWISLAILLRIDLALALLPLAALSPRPQNAEPTHHRIAVVATIVAPMLLVASYHFLVTGVPYSVSSLAKVDALRHTPLLEQVLLNLSGYGNQFRYGAVVLLNLLVVPRLFRQRPLLEAGAVVCAVDLFLLVHTLFSSTRDWHFAPAIFPLLYLAARERAEPRHRQVRNLLVSALGAGAVALWIAYQLINAPARLSTDRFFAEVKQHVARDARIYADDGSGHLAWRLRRHAHVINGDGLVNSFDFYRRTRANPCLDDYFRANDVGFVITNHLGQRDRDFWRLCEDDSPLQLLVEAESTRPYLAFTLFAVRQPPAPAHGAHDLSGHHPLAR